MNSDEIFRMALGLESPWEVTKISFEINSKGSKDLIASLKALVLFSIIFISSCINKQIPDNLNTDCEIIGMVYDTFIKTNKNEFRYMKLDRFYICQFANMQMDSNLIMQNLTNLASDEYIKFNENNLTEIGKICLNLEDIKFIDSGSALDSMMMSKTTNKVIWGITNYQRNTNYAYLVFGTYFSKRAVITSQY